MNAVTVHTNVQAPMWFRNVIAGLISACENYRTRYNKIGVILGFEENTEGRKVGYYIRLQDGSVGYFPKRSLMDKDIATSMSLRGTLPDPEFLAKEPAYKSFVFQTIREQVKLVPLLWLNRVIQDILDGVGKTELYSKHQQDVKKWLRLPEEVKRNQKRVDVLRLLMELEGLVGLAKCNDWGN